MIGTAGQNIDGIPLSENHDDDADDDHDDDDDDRAVQNSCMWPDSPRFASSG